MDDQPFTVAEAVYYLMVWLVAAVAGINQTLRTNSNRNCWHTLNSGMASGLLAFAIVSFIDGDVSSRGGSEFFYLGVAALIGLSINRQQELIEMLYDKAIVQFGLNKNTCDPKDDEGSE